MRQLSQPNSPTLPRCCLRVVAPFGDGLGSACSTYLSCEIASRTPSAIAEASRPTASTIWARDAC